MIRISTTRQESEMHGVKLLIYGRAGVGKTYLARTAPNPLIVSAESGLLALRDVEIPVVTIKTMPELDELYAWVSQSREADQFHTIYIDSLSEIAEVVLSNAKATVKDPRAAYGELTDRMLINVKRFRDLQGKHVVMSAKQSVMKDENTGITTIGPDMPGRQLGPALPYMFDEVFRLGIGKTPAPENQTYRFLQTAPDLQYDAKDRSGSLEAIEPADLTYIINKILAIAPEIPLAEAA